MVRPGVLLACMGCVVGWRLDLLSPSPFDAVVRPLPSWLGSNESCVKPRPLLVMMTSAEIVSLIEVIALMFRLPRSTEIHLLALIDCFWRLL